MRLLVFAGLFLSLADAVWSQSLEASVERQTVIDGESIVLYLKGDGLNELPDVSALNQSFDILDSRRSNSRVVDQGVMRSNFMMRFELLAKNLGQVEIPAFTADGQSSQALRIDVVERGTAGVTPRDKVFTEITFDKENPYVQSQIIMSLHILDDGSLASVDPQPPVIPGVQVERLPAGEQRIEARDGVEYRVHTWRYALFPQRNGEIEIPRMQIAGSVKDPSYGGNLILRNMATRRISIRTQPATINVKARAEQSTADWWLPVEKLELTSEWSADIKNSKVGEPLTLTLSLTTQGATSNQLPEIPAPQIKGLKIYPDVPELISQPNEEGLISRRRQKWSVIPLQDGLIEIPAVSVKWWDTTAETERTATLPAQQLVVAAAEGEATESRVSDVPVVSAQPDQLPESASNEQESAVPLVNEITDGALPAKSLVWKWIAIIALAGWAITLVTWYRAHRRKQAQTTVATPRQSLDDVPRLLEVLRVASNKGDVPAFRAALMEWSRGYWPQGAPIRPADIGVRLGNTDLQAQLQLLESTLYGQGQSGISLPDIYTTLSNSVADHKNATVAPTDPLPTL